MVLHLRVFVRETEMVLCVCLRGMGVCVCGGGKGEDRGRFSQRGARLLYQHLR